MKISRLKAKQTVGLVRLNENKILLLALLTFCLNMESAIAGTNVVNSLAKQADKTIRGQSGGTIDSQGCGFVSSNPSYEINLEQKIDYMRLTVQADGGQPTLLVIGPNSEDSFCVLGDEISGLKPEISGVWEAGFYRIFVGELTRNQHQFTLDISTAN
ncbi:MAG: hypothetical protein AAFQ80_16090 [Cyanobacteria bacterium J06621_8]